VDITTANTFNKRSTNQKTVIKTKIRSLTLLNPVKIKELNLLHKLN